MFLLKKIIAPFLFPIPIIVVLLLIGLALLWRTRGKERRRGPGWILAAFVVLVIVSFRPVPSYMMSTLEYEYPPLLVPPDTSVGGVVVLAAGVTDDPALHEPQRLSGSSVIRLVEGVRLFRHVPKARLVLSGGAPFSSVAAATVMKNLAVELGVPDSSIVVEEASLDTKDQAVAIANIVHDQPFILVTSAMHMPRSMALFKAQGLSPTAAPTDHLARKPTTVHPGGFFPSSLNIRTARLAWREYLGMMWAKIRGQA